MAHSQNINPLLQFLSSRLEEQNAVPDHVLIQDAAVRFELGWPAAPVIPRCWRPLDELPITINQNAIPSFILRRQLAAEAKENIGNA